MIVEWDIPQVRFGCIEDVQAGGNVLVRTDDDGSTVAAAFTLETGLAASLTAAGKALLGHRVSMLPHKERGRTETLLVLEPDITIDVTEASSLIGDHGLMHSTLALKRLREIGPASAAMVTGTVVNAALDALVRQPRLGDTEVIAEAMQARPLAMAALAYDGQKYNELHKTVRRLLAPLRSMVDSWKGADVVLEPFLISPTLGLQGRADIVVRRDRELTVIELKVGRPRVLDRPDHLAQVASYVALLEAARDPADTIMGQVWTIADDKHPMRYLEDLAKPIRSIIDARNAIVANDLLLQQSDVAMLRVAQRGPMGYAGISSYERDEWDKLSRQLTSLRLAEKHVVTEWLRMAANESMSARLGGGSARCAADLWRLTPEQRRLSPGVLCDLTFDRERSNLDAMHLTFTRVPQPMPTAIRTGDAVVLRRFVENEHTESSTTGMVLYKGSVRSIDADHVTVSLRNKYADITNRIASGWMIEQDVTDAGVRSTSSSIRSLISADARRRDVLLGLASPTHNVPTPSIAPNLTDVQRRIVERAVAARELFLIQGPPGSGKTSAVLRAIIQELLREPRHRVLALAFTNRAANEICDVLKRYGVHYLRQGSVEGATGEGSIPRLARDLKPEELSETISTASVIVATVASIHSGPEIWSLCRFDTVIVDEASQIIEPQLIGILARCPRTIMIGDHCQLPAVISQPPEQLAVSKPQLEELCMTNLGMSGFERLIRCAHRRGDSATVAMLTQQGRMHQDIMRFPSEAFYGGRLTCLRHEQTSTAGLAWADVLSERMCMIEIDAQQQLMAEASMLSRLAKRILMHPSSRSQPPSIGIITPFRVQNNAVMHLLDQALAPEMRSHVIVDTVERFQGSECDVILYGTAVTTEQELDSIRSDVKIDEVLVDRKLNVAITRAREQFVLVGSLSVLSASAIYRRLMDEIPHRQPAL